MVYAIILTRPDAMISIAAPVHSRSSISLRLFPCNARIEAATRAGLASARACRSTHATETRRYVVSLRYRLLDISSFIAHRDRTAVLALIGIKVRVGVWGGPVSHGLCRVHI